MSYRLLCEALLSSRPYFGPALCAIQGPPERHQYFRPAVKAAAAGTASSWLQILEVGSWAGASAISFGIALSDLGIEGEITCVDAWKSYFDTDTDHAHVYRQMNSAADEDKIYKLFQHNIAAAGIAGRIHIHRGLSQCILPDLPSNTYDLVYIDGSHRYPEALSDIRQGIRLVKEGGILCGDDLELQSNQIDPGELAEAAQSRRDVVFSPSANGYYHPGVTAAVSEAIGQVSTWAGFWAIRCTSNDFEPVILDLETAEVPPHVRPTLYQRIGSSGNYDLYLRDQTYFAVSSWVPKELVDELLWGDEFRPMIFRGDTLAELEQKITANSPSPTEPEECTPRIIGEYRGFNLVAFAGTIYGLRQAAGKIDLLLGDEALLQRYGDDDVITGASVAEVKSRIDFMELGKAASVLENRVHSIEQAITLIHATVQKPETTIQETLLDFNVVRMEGRVYGLRTSLGPVDLNQDENALMERYHPDDLVIADSIEGVCSRIALIESLRLVKNEIRVAEERWTGEEERRRGGVSTLLDQQESKLQEYLHSALKQHETRLQGSLRALAKQQGDFETELLQELNSRQEAAQRQFQGALSTQRLDIDATVQALATMVHGLADANRAAVQKLNAAVGRIEACLDEMRYGTGDRTIPRLVETYRGFQLVRQEDKVYAIPEASTTDKPVIDSSSPDIAKARIDAYLTEQLVKQILEDRQHSLLRSALSKWRS